MWNNFEVLSQEEVFNDTFSINTIFRIKNESNTAIQRDPNLRATFSNKIIAIAIDETLIIFENENFDDGKSMDFDATIDCLTVSNDGKLIICGLSNGCINGVHYQGVPIFTVEINGSDVETTKGHSFVDVVEFNGAYYFCCKNGKIYKVHNIDTDELFSEENGTNDTVNLSETLANNVLLDSIISKRLAYNISAYAITLYEGKPLHVLSGDDYIFLRNESIDRKISLQNMGIEHLQSISDILIFTTKVGHLYEMNPYMSTFTPLMQTSNIKDFIMTEGKDNAIELLALVGEPRGDLSLKIYEYPYMECKFSLPVSNEIWLMAQPKSAANIFYLNGLKSSTFGSIERIDLRMVSESQPEKRLQTLLAKKLLVEAEEFAKKFKLNLQPVYEAKAKMILQDIGLIDRNDRQAIEKRFDELISVAKMITNTEFILQLRILDMPERKIMKKLLQFLSEHIKLDKNQKVGEEIKEQLLRLNTLQMIDPNECDMHWQKFVQHPNIGNYCFKFLDTDISMACLILKQHASSIIPHLKEEIVIKILKAIPQQIEPFGIIQWMRHYFPLVSEAYPQTTQSIIDWVIQKTKSFQCLEQWPDIGVEFGNKMLEIFMQVKYTFADTRRRYDQSIEKLRDTIHTLEELLVLKERFNLRIPFDDYYNNSVEECGLSLLQRINIRNLPNLVNNFLFAIFSEHQKDLQATLIKYLDYLIKNRKVINVWQERAMVCLQLIRHQETKLKCAYQIAKIAPVPWSDTLKPIIELCSSNHPIARHINEEFRLQEIKLLLSKYGWTTGIEQVNYTIFMQRMIRENRDELFDDLNIFKRFNEDKKNEVNLYCIRSLTVDGHLEKALRYLGSLNDADAKYCHIKIAKIIPQIIEDYINKPDVYDRLMELLKFVMNKNIEPEHIDRIKHLIDLNRLRKSPLKMNISIGVLSGPAAVQQFVDFGVDALIECIKSFDGNVIANIRLNIQLLANALKQNQINIVLKLAKKINNVQFTTILGKSFLEEINGNDPNAIEMAILLMSQQYNALLSDYQDDVITFAYPIAYLYAQKYFSKTKMFEIQQIVHFAKIGSNAFELTQIEDYLNENTQKDDEIIETIFDSLTDGKPNDISHRRNSMSVFEEVNHVKPIPIIEHKTDIVIKTLSMLLHVIIYDLVPNTPLYTHFKDFIFKKENVHRSKLITSLEQMIKIKLYTAVYSIMHCIECQQKGNQKQLLGTSLKEVLIRKILRSALHQKEPSFNLLVPILHTDPDPEAALRLLKTELKNGNTKINCLQLSEKYNEFIGNSTLSKSEKDTRLKYHYGLQLRQLDPGLKEDFEIGSYNEMFRDLNQKILEIQLLGRMSTDFDWNYQKVLISQILTILSIQELEFDTEINEWGKEKLIMNVSTDKIRSLCNPYIEQISDTKSLAKSLNEFIETINPYFYEMFAVVIGILNDVHELRDDMKSWEQILLFLKHKMTTKRSRRIGQFENDWWMSKQSDLGVMPKISKFRLPFLMVITKPILNVLDEQVTIQDCVEWFPLIQLHLEMHGVRDSNEISYSQDTLCITAFKQAMNEVQLNENSNGAWRLQPTNNAFLQSVLYMVEHMKDIERISLVLYMAFSNTHEGADQVEAAYECYKFVMKHEAELSASQRSRDIVRKIKSKYPIVKAQHQLHLYGLYDDDLSMLITNPTELIKALYSRSSIVSGEIKADLNEMAKKFAEIFDLNFANIQTNLLKSWLSFAPDEGGNPLEQTFYDDMNVTLSPTRDEYEVTNDEVERAYYILKSWNPMEASQFIVNHLFSTKDESAMNTGRQLQLYECLIKLANENIDQNFISFVEKSKYIALKCIHFLKPFGFKLSIEKFQNYDKLKILKQVWSSYATNPKALNVITYICMGYDIYEPIIWNNVLRQMVALHMGDELNAIIDKISVQPSLVHADGLVIAFEYLIRLPFQNVIQTHSDEQDVKICKALFMLQSCPVKHKMNLINLAETCISLKQFHAAGLMIALVEEESRSKVFQLVETHRSKNLRKEILNLEEYGIYPFVTKEAVKLLNL